MADKAKIDWRDMKNGFKPTAAYDDEKRWRG